RNPPWSELYSRHCGPGIRATTPQQAQSTAPSAPVASATQNNGPRRPGAAGSDRPGSGYGRGGSGAGAGAGRSAAPGGGGGGVGGGGGGGWGLAGGRRGAGGAAAPPGPGSGPGPPPQRTSRPAASSVTRRVAPHAGQVNSIAIARLASNPSPRVDILA